MDTIFTPRKRYELSVSDCQSKNFVFHATGTVDHLALSGMWADICSKSLLSLGTYVRI